MSGVAEVDVKDCMRDGHAGLCGTACGPAWRCNILLYLIGWRSVSRHNPCTDQHV
jgi:hypothetical protein